MSDLSNAAMVKCGYCGNYHNYSYAMCRDIMLRPPTPMLVEIPEIGEAFIRADERKRLREGAEERAVIKHMEMMNLAGTHEGRYWKSIVAAIFGEDK
jgi:hypothetical protein